MLMVMLLYYDMCRRGYLILQLSITAGLFPQEAKIRKLLEMAFLAYQAAEESCDSPDDDPLYYECCAMSNLEV